MHRVDIEHLGDVVRPGEFRALRSVRIEAALLVQAATRFDQMGENRKNSYGVSQKLVTNKRLTTNRP